MTIILSVLLILSVALNISLVWYLRQLAENYSEMNGEILSVRADTENMLDHMEKVYNMDRIYGDSTIEGLLAHMKDFGETLQAFTQRFTLTLEDEENEEEID